MKPWLIFGLLIGTLYYLYNNTDIFDGQKAEAQNQYEQLQDKVKSMTSIQVASSVVLPADIRNNFQRRMTNEELAELELILSSWETISDFKDNFCADAIPSHPIFSRENTRGLCDMIQE